MSDHRRLTEAEKWFRSVHESGHAVICEHLRFPIVCVSIADCLERNRAGFTLSILPENMTSYQKSDEVRLADSQQNFLCLRPATQSAAKLIAYKRPIQLGLSGVPGYENASPRYFNRRFSILQRGRCRLLKNSVS